MAILTKIKSLFATSNYDVKKDEELELKNKIFEIENKANFKIEKKKTKTKQQVEKWENRKTTKVNKLNRKLTRIRMTKFNEAKYICEDSCILDTLNVEAHDNVTSRTQKPEETKETKTKKKIKK